MMKFGRLIIAATLLLVPVAQAAGTSGQPIVSLVGATCQGSGCNGGVPNDVTHPFFFAPSTGAVWTVVGTFTLPTGAATSANQVTGNTTLQSVLDKLNASVAVTGTFFQATQPVSGTFWQATQPISAAALPLPSGAATETTLAAVNTKLGSALPLPTGASSAANQATEITALQTLATASASQATAANQTTGNTSAATTATNTGTTATNTGSTATNTSTTATNTTAISSATGTTADAAYSGSGNSTIVAILKGIYSRVAAAASSLAGTLTISGSVTTTPGAGSQPIIAGATTPAGPDISTVTTGGTAVNAFAATHCARGCIIVNPKGATVDLCVNGTGAASGTTTAGALICVPPGQQYGFTARPNAISVVSSDSSHPFGGEGFQ